MIRMLPLAVALLLFAAAFSATAKTNAPASSAALPTNRLSTLQLSEHLRVPGIAERRSVYGKMLRIFPHGILVESGYTNLLRAPLTRSWLVPGRVIASRAQNLVESKEPGALCVGTVFLTDLLRRGKPHQFDYVIITGYPTGGFTCASVGTLKKTVRPSSANLDMAVAENLARAQDVANETVR